MKTSLTALENHDAFLKRHIGPSSQDEVSMLNFLGFKKKSELIDSVIPSKIRRKDQLPLGTYSSAKREDEALQLLNTIANKIKFSNLLLDKAISTI